MCQKHCAACEALFTRRRNVPQQRFCSKPECQRERRRRWQREKLSEDAVYKGKLKFVKVSVDDESALAGRYNVMSIPTLMIFKKGKLADVRMGALPEPDLREWIEKNIGKK